MSVSPHRLGVPAAAIAATLCLLFAPSAFAGDPAASIKINEIESSGASDFIELVNVSDTATDASGLVLKDNDDSRTLAVPAGTTIPAGGFLAIDNDVAGGFGMGSPDSARLFMPDGVTQLDGHSWTSHAETTWGRCTDGTGMFVVTGAETKGAANACPPPPAAVEWPGSQVVSPVDQSGALGPDVSGLTYEGSGTAAPGVLWAVDNGNGSLHRLLWDGGKWVRDTANGWSTGKVLRFPDGTGFADSEGVTMTDAGSAGGLYVSSERNGAANTVSRPSVLRYDVSGPGAPLDATHEWDLNPDLPDVEANEGVESVEWVPDSYLVDAGFVKHDGTPYDPAAYPNHGTGLFFAGLEANGSVYAFALDHATSDATLVASFESGFPTFGALHFEPATEQLWVTCDNNCAGRSRVFEVDGRTGATKGDFVAVASYERPSGMNAYLNNEGFVITPASECVGGMKPVFWADDGNTDSGVLRAGAIACSPEIVAAPGGSSGGGAQVRGDFNGDGRGDLAVGSPGESVGGDEGAGMVQVFYGSANGLTGTGATSWSQDTTGIDGLAEPGDGFGAALAAGDFNGDGRADLAIGAPGENAGAGQVHVLRGGASGLEVTADQIVSQNTAGVDNVSETGDHFGASLAAGRFDQGAMDDLAIGVPDEDSTVADVGIVQVLPGSASGVTATGNKTWGQATSGIADVAEAGDHFGFALAAGNLDAGAQDELVAGAPGESSSTRPETGVVHVIPGASAGLTATGSQAWTQNSAGVGDSSEAFDRFGSSLAIGNFGGSTAGDLAIGVPSEDFTSLTDVGIVQVLPGTDAGPTATGMQTFSESTAGVAGNPESGDAFGAALAAGDVGGSVESELVVGAPGESSTTLARVGVVHVLPGSVGGTTASGSQVWSQDSSGITDASETGDAFGSTLAVSRFSLNTRDVVIGVPGEDAGSARDSGIVHLLRGAAGSPGLTSTSSRVLDQATAGGVAEAGDRFGGALGR